MKMRVDACFCVLYPRKLMLRKMGKPDTLRILDLTVSSVKTVELSGVQLDSRRIGFRSYVWSPQGAGIKRS